jgi:hypothetical protein
MAGTIVTGDISTEEQLGPSAATSAEGEKQIDMNETIQKLDKDQSQFTTMSTRTPSRVATREKVNWLEEELFPRTVTTSASALAGATSIVLVAGQGKIVAGQDLLRNMRTGEGARVVSVATDTLTISPTLGAIQPAAAINSGDVYLVVGDSQPQGSDFPTARYLQRVLGYNFTQITRTTWSFTGTDTAIEKYGGREPGKEAVRKAIEHKRKWESIGFFGIRSFVASASNTEPQGTAGGAIEFITSIKRDANGPLTVPFFDQFVTDTFARGSEDKVFFCSPAIAQNMSGWNRSGMGNSWDPSPRNVHGVQVDAFVSGAYGFRIPVIVKREWSQFPTANKGYGGYGFLLDMSYIERRPLRDRDTKLLTEQQPKGRDTYAAEYMTEASYQFACQLAHGIVYGVTAPT